MHILPKSLSLIFQIPFLPLQVFYMKIEFLFSFLNIPLSGIFYSISHLINGGRWCRKCNYWSHAYQNRTLNLCWTGISRKTLNYITLCSLCIHNKVLNLQQNHYPQQNDSYIKVCHTYNLHFFALQKSDNSFYYLQC